MKRIVICFDGTWNKPADENLPPEEQLETNVRRFFERIKSQGGDSIKQVKWYDEGVGSKWYNKYIGGAVGAGLERNIIDGYKALAKEYKDGDEVYILGFSRGAYTARSLVGMIRNIGLVYNKQLTFRVAMAYGIYRTRDDGPDSTIATWFRSMYARPIRIKFIGVWDTVGTLGIPLAALQDFNGKFYEFHDTRLSKIVDHAYHAIAVDEHRKDYDVCLWNPAEPPTQTMEQRWFIGAHSDVGGGYADRRLSDITLRWIQDKASALGLALDPVSVTDGNIKGDYADSYMEFLSGKYAKLNPRNYRRVCKTQFGQEVVDDSVQKRRKSDSSYEPQNDGLPVVG